MPASPFITAGVDPEALPPGPRPGVADDVASAQLRLLALSLADGADLSRLDDHHVAAGLAAARASGRLRLVAQAPPTLMRLAFSPAGGEVPGAASAAGPRREAAVEAATPPENTFAADLDAEAMAAALVQAAQDGVPFCEECARAAARATA